MKHLSLFACVLLAGCGLFREAGKIGCEEMTLNAQAIRELAPCILKNWLVFSGLIRESLGANMKELSVEVVDAMDKLDEYSIRYKADPNSFGDMELGGAVGLKLRMLWAVVLKALETYAPDVLKYLI